MRLIGARALLACFLVSCLLSSTFSAKINHVIVLMEENRSFDHMFGWYPGANGLTGKEYNLVDTKDPKSKKVFVDKLEPYIAPCDPDHDTIPTTNKIFGMAAVEKNDFRNASMSGFVEWENHRGNAKTNYCDVMSMLTPEHVPVISALASEFALMDRFFAAHAGPTWPNRIFMLSATSAGLSETGPWYHGDTGKLFPQQTIFDQVAKEGLMWKNYYNDTPWELFLESIAHNPEHLAPIEQLYEDARTGNLPNFAWINPRSGINMTTMQGSNDHHPDHDIRLGEEYYKDIYEALRASPQWNETLFIVTYDEHGGYYDHVSTPLHVPPPGDGEESYPDKGIMFDRLGLRLPTILISPWIPKGVVVGAPPAAQKPANNSEYTLTSIMATARKLLGMKSGPLTKRDAWSATFEQVLSLSEPRTDCPMHLPDAARPSPNYSPAAEAKMPINGLQKHIMTVHSHLGGVEYPDHVTEQGHVAEWNKKQLHKHVERTKAWKKSKLSLIYDLVLRPRISLDWVSHGWNLNKGQKAEYITISVRLHDLCLDYGKEAVANATVTTSACYPSSDPDTNRDPSQQWVWTWDTTIRPYANQNLCLTNRLLQGDDKVYLEPCVRNNVQQHWSYHGPAEGNQDAGYLYFGDYTYTLGIVLK